MIIVDANIVSEVDKPNPNANALKWLKRQDPLSVFLCTPVVMEQAYGAELFLLRTGSNRYAKILSHVISVRFQNRVLQFVGDCPMEAGKMRASRERAGRPISVQDSMIAAICLVNGATLATRNVRDFDGLNLKLVNPFEPAA